VVLFYRHWALLQSHSLMPCEGGTADQPAVFLEACSVANKEKAILDEEKKMIDSKKAEARRAPEKFRKSGPASGRSVQRLMESEPQRLSKKVFKKS